MDDVAPLSTPLVALTIAGSDSSGGAGIQADLKTFSALGVYGASVITALTAQNTIGVSAGHAAPAAFVAAQMDAVFGDLTVAAIKTGMLANAEIVEAVADRLTKLDPASGRDPRPPVVVDPVMVATSGDRLLSADAVDAYRKRLFPLAALITPNLPEAAALLGEALAGDVEGAERQARALLAFGSGAVLVKGGHGGGPDAIDVLATRDGVRLISARFIDTRNTHGTGCTLSAAIAARLALGDPLERAVTSAKQYLTSALAAAREQTVGRGHGPVDHLFAIRRRDAAQGRSS